MRFSASNNPQNHIYTKIAKLHIRICDELPQYVTADQQEHSFKMVIAYYLHVGLWLNM